MFGLSLSHLLLLSVIALVVIGPKQLPEVARMLGRMLNELKRATSDITESLVDARDTTNESLTRNHIEKENATAAKSPQIKLEASSEVKPEPRFVIHERKPDDGG